MTDELLKLEGLFFETIDLEVQDHIMKLPFKKDIQKTAVSPAGISGGDDVKKETRAMEVCDEPGCAES